MKLTLKRRYFAETYTIGTLFIDGVRFAIPWKTRTGTTTETANLTMGNRR